MKGAVASGHIETSKAAIEAMEAGGNAADAALAALTTSSVCEPILTSPFGGGFMLWVPKSAKPVVYDFFVQTPKKKRPESELDFYPKSLQFGAEEQVYHLGWGSIGVPGLVKGIFEIHRDLGTLAIDEIFAPAIRIAREGYTVNDMNSYVYTVLKDVIGNTEEARKTHSNPHTNEFYQAGDIFRSKEMLSLFEILVADGDKALYGGDVGSELAKLMKENGGYISEKDLADYQVIKRKPISSKFGKSLFLSCPPPSMSGLFLRLALNLVNDIDFETIEFRSPKYYLFLTKLLEIAAKAREQDLDAKLMDVNPMELWETEESLSQYKPEVKKAINFLGNTTHLSVIDKDENIAVITSSSGSSAGLVAPGFGFLMNNMLGEQDLNPNGFHKWDTDIRLASSMSPSVVIREDGSRLGFGSAGSNRIRSALLQSLLNFSYHGLSLEDSICEPRLHLEESHVSLEGGIPIEAANLIAEKGYNVELWDELNMFFGGTHAVYYCAKNQEFISASDPRRHGHATIHR